MAKRKAPKLDYDSHTLNINLSRVGDHEGLFNQLIKEMLDKHFQANCLLANNVSSAVELCLKSFGHPKKPVALVPPNIGYEAANGILRAGMQLRFYDIDPDFIGLSLANLRSHDMADVEFLIVKHTAGMITPGLEQIHDHLKTIEGPFLIEDCTEAWASRTATKQAGKYAAVSYFDLGSFIDDPIALCVFEDEDCYESAHCISSSRRRYQLSPTHSPGFAVESAVSERLLAILDLHMDSILKMEGTHDTDSKGEYCNINKVMKIILGKGDGGAPPRIQAYKYPRGQIENLFTCGIPLDLKGLASKACIGMTKRMLSAPKLRCNLFLDNPFWTLSENSEFLAEGQLNEFEGLREAQSRFILAPPGMESKEIYSWCLALTSVLELPVREDIYIP